MANVKDGSGTDAICDYQGLSHDTLHSDGSPTRDFRVMGSPTRSIQVETNDSFAALYLALRDTQAEDKRPQQQLATERSKRLPPHHHQQPTANAAAAASGASAAAGGGGGLWPQWQHSTAHNALPSSSSSSSSAGLPGVAAVGPQVGHHLQQRSASSQSAAAAVIASLDFSSGESAAPLLGRLRDLEEAGHRWAAAEDEYQQQIQKLKARVDELCAEGERLRKALAAARSMAPPAVPPQLQDSDSGFTTTQQGQHPTSLLSTAASSSPASLLADHRWSSMEDSYKRQIQELAGELAHLRAEHVTKTEQLQQYKDELEVVYGNNELLKRKLSTQAPAQLPAGPQQQQQQQLYPDSGWASQGLHTSSSAINSSLELSADALPTIMHKVQKSREAIDELKSVVRQQTEVIKRFKVLFDSKCKHQPLQGEPAGGGADARAGFSASPALATVLPQHQQQREHGGTLPLQSCRLSSSVRKSGGAPLSVRPEAALFAAVSPACFSYTLQPGLQMPVRVGYAAGAGQQHQPSAVGSAAPSAQQVVIASAGRQAVEQSDQSRSLGLITAGGGGVGDDALDDGWANDVELVNRLERRSKAPFAGSTPAEAYDSVPTAEAERAFGGHGSVPADSGTIAPTMVSQGPRSIATLSAHRPAPAGTAADREHRICPVCNARFSSLEPLERLQEHILDCEGTSVATQLQPTAPLPDGSSEAVAGHGDERTCPMCNAHFPPELPQREYELHVMSHFEEDYVVASREPLPSRVN